MLNGDDIQYVYSGTNNSDPSSSLGGNPSAHSIPTGINNLFADLTQEQIEEGRTDYRCFYIFNNSSTDSLYEANLWIQSEIEGGTSIEIGLNLTNDIQRVYIVGTITGGNLVLNYDGNDFDFSWDSSLETWATNFQAAMNDLEDLSGVSVSASQSGTTTLFEVTFAGDDKNRYHPLLTLTTNGLSGAPPVTITRLTTGGPINSIAPEIDVDTTPPTGITFSTPSASNPLVLGEIKPTEGFPVWIKRICPAGIDPVAEDGFKIRLAGSPV